jgi:hypothetical protein
MDLATVNWPVVAAILAFVSIGWVESVYFEVRRDRPREKI